MAERITSSKLQDLVAYANDLLGFKDAGANPYGEQYIGALQLYGAYDGYGINRLQSAGGGVDSLLGIGTAKECALWLRGFIAAIRVKNEPKHKKGMKPNRFMDVYVEGPCDWLIVETSIGTEVVPFDVVGSRSKADVRQYVEGDVQDVSVQRGWGVHLSAAGYMDQTPWEYFRTKAQAMKRAKELDEELSEEEGAEDYPGDE